MLNRFDQMQMYAATMHACVFAVREGFPHLTARDIIDPPHEWFDAALARQVVIHLMVREFEWPKRRVVEVEDRSREAVNRALRTIERRMETPRFATHYRSMASRARALLFIRTSGTEAA
ncbi:hypothetical protein CN234_16945 [Sinorhizobium meliloti]|uniref:hypothetical protein n=1 Tax=Rhizobium meliloti TaxID=382 RepID=UPI000FD81130|nr:hypothetical protein [Sinorhizobium meliloti]RVG08839.1 hypothetical protein CN234_16945 [Sinorhizobium meliloti]